MRIIMRLCEDTLAHDGSQPIPAATHIVMEFGSPSESPEDTYSHEYAVCTSCLEFLASSKWINVEIVEELVAEKIVKPSTCAECGHKGTDVSNRPWFVPNQHDSGIVPVCEPCWQGSTPKSECCTCGAPVRSFEDFCGKDCWNEWHHFN